MAEKKTHTINYHLKKIFSDHELDESSVIRNFRITALDGKNYNTRHYNLSAIIAVGYMVKEMEQLQRLVSPYLDIAEELASPPMTMEDWETRLNKFIEATDREILQNTGKVTAEIAKVHVETEFEKYRITQDRLFESDFDRMIKQQLPTNEKEN